MSTMNKAALDSTWTPSNAASRIFAPALTPNCREQVSKPGKKFLDYPQLFLNVYTTRVWVRQWICITNPTCWYFIAPCTTALSSSTVLGNASSLISSTWSMSRECGISASAVRPVFTNWELAQTLSLPVGLKRSLPGYVQGLPSRASAWKEWGQPPQLQPIQEHYLRRGNPTKKAKSQYETTICR